MKLQEIRDILQRVKDKLSNIDMTTGAPWKKLLLFTLPLLIGNLFQQMYSTADAIILGRFVGDYALAAVGSSIPIFFLVLVIMMGIAMGAGVMVSQYFGAKKREELSYTVGAALTLTTILGVFMMVVFPFFTRPLLVLLETPAEILDDSVLYMNVLIIGILGMAYFNILSGILRGLGDAFSPLLYLAIASILNIFLNLLFIPVLGWGVWGAAIGTVMAQGLTSFLCLRRLLKMRNVFDMGLKYLKPNKVYISKVLKLSVPTAASQAIFAIAMMVVQPLANRFGPSFIAVNIIVMRIDGFIMMPNFSFGNAMTVFAGQNMGAGKLDRVGQGIKQCAIMAVGTAAVMVGIMLIFGRFIAGAFSETPDVVEFSMYMFRILAIGYIIFAFNMVIWGVIRGAGDAMTPMWASFINTIIIRVPSAFLFVFLLERPEALFYSLLLAWVTNTILGVIAYRLGRWRKMGLVKHEKLNEEKNIQGDVNVMETNIKNMVDERFEFAALIGRLAERPEYSDKRFGANNTNYHKEVEEKFAHLKNHEAIIFAKENVNHYHFDSVANFAIHLKLDNGKFSFVNNIDSLYKDERWNEEIANEFLKYFNKFYTDSNYADFFAAHQELFEESTKKFVDETYGKINFNWFAKYVDVSKLRCIYSLSSGNYAPHGDGDVKYCIVHHEGRAIVHEYCHFIGNPLADKWYEENEEFKKLCDDSVDNEIMPFYGNGVFIAHEYVTRALDVLYHVESGENVDECILQVRDVGGVKCFPYMKQVYDMVQLI